MNNELSVQLTELAKKLGTSVDKLYEATIKQAKIQLIYEVIQLIIFGGVVWGLFTLYLWMPDFDNNPNDISLIELVKIGSVLSCFASTLIFILSFAGTIKDIVTLYSNPEYWAMQDILASVNLNDE